MTMDLGKGSIETSNTRPMLGILFVVHMHEFSGVSTIVA